MESELRQYDHSHTRIEIPLQQWPNGKKVAVIFCLNVEIYTKFGISIQPHLNKNNPDIANSGWRKYGNKNGLPRLVQLMEQFEAPFDVALNADCLTEESFIWTDILANTSLPFSITAHGLNNTFQLPTNDTQEQHRDFTKEYVRETLDVIETHTKRRPRGWLSGGFSAPHYLNQVLAEMGLEYSLDCCDDEVVYKNFINENKSLTMIPYCMETNDVSLCVSQNKSNEVYAQALVDHISQLNEEAKTNNKATIVSCGMHTFIAGQPGRVFHLKKALEQISKLEHVWFANYDMICEAINKQ